jgi:H+/Cl- antiporter ClcA
MSDIDRMVANIRPKLRHIAPQTFWFSVGFGVFNAIIGWSLYNLTILVNLRLVGIVPIRWWAAIFFVHGLSMLVSLAINNWKMTRALHFVGVLIKSAWWLELFAATIVGRTAFLLYIWSLLLFLQIVVCIYFTPRVNRD